VTTGNFEALRRTVVAASKSSQWKSAAHEWEVITVGEDPSGTGICVCGQNNLRYLFTIENLHNGNILFPIGSTCVNQFESEYLDDQVKVFTGLRKLRKAIDNRESIELTSDYFSRALLQNLYNDGAFTPDKWNRGDGEVDYIFLLDMFNTRNKDDISRKRQGKIYMLLTRKIIPFVKADKRLT
jgi:hypothetical protein